MEATYKVDGMTCSGCAGSVTRALERIGLKVLVDLAKGTAKVEGAVDDALVRKAVEGAGYDFVARLA